MRKLILFAGLFMSIATLYIMANVMRHDDNVITSDDYLRTIIPYESTIDDVAKLDPDVYDKVEYVGGNLSESKHQTGDDIVAVYIVYTAGLKVQSVQVVE